MSIILWKESALERSCNVKGHPKWYMFPTNEQGAESVQSPICNKNYPYNISDFMKDPTLLKMYAKYLRYQICAL